MGKKDSHTSDAGGIQVFELTMDNPEEQDELNRRLQKPGEPDRSPPTKIRRTAQRETAMDSAENQKGMS